MKVIELRFAATLYHKTHGTRGLTVMAETHADAKIQIEKMLRPGEYIYDIFIDV